MKNFRHTLILVSLILLLTAGEKIVAQTNEKEFENFCVDVKDVRKTADEAFEAIKGNLRSETGNALKETVHETTKWISGAKDCSIKNTFGNSYYANFGEFDTQKDAEVKFSYYLTYFDLCFMGDRAVKEGEPYGNIVKLSSVVTVFNDSFCLEGDNFYILKNQAGKYEVLLNINTEKKSDRVYTFRSTSLFDGFSDDFKKIMNSAANGFKEVLGEKKEIDGFMGKSYKYAINASLYGISDLSYSEGGLSFAQDVTGIFYEGTDKAAAKEKFASLTEKIKNTLGFAFDEKHVYRKSESTDGEFMQHIFAKESEIYNENAALAIAEYSYDKFSKKYLVKLKFSYKGFSGMF